MNENSEMNAVDMMDTALANAGSVEEPTGTLTAPGKKTKAPAKPKKTANTGLPNFQVAEFKLEGTAPLVIHRFSAKTKREMTQKMETGKAAASKKQRDAVDLQERFNEARYRGRDADGTEWDGFHAASVRNALISACRLSGHKMTLAKLSLFVHADGNDVLEPQIPLIRIRGCEPVRQEDMARVETGTVYVTVRPAYHNWSALIRVRWDADQFTLDAVKSLLVRVGMQVGIGEGRPDSKNSAGMGWGLFDVTYMGSKPYQFSAHVE